MFKGCRAYHSLAVAKLMYDKALQLTGNEFYAKKMFHLGMIHDIGYQFTENNKEHAKVGGSFLKAEGYEFWEAVYEHGNPEIQNLSTELDLLNWADMHVDGNGNMVSFEERLKDIATRYGEDTDEYRYAKAVIDHIVVSFENTWRKK